MEVAAKYTSRANITHHIRIKLLFGIFLVGVRITLLVANSSHKQENVGAYGSVGAICIEAACTLATLRDNPRYFNR